ncbi:unnamed protein product [Cyprideis torosa]|uniref:Pre-mRNA-splicing factor SYF1 n=1 Tax=Cyprideis torosa TaxID=163714 RepID=A0A7R8ZT99_9CRUS|nr:unnamed protein product [Cyprideis torosa]CAG0907276.1 unnamed protein product [Cyprideis torosa]
MYVFVVKGPNWSVCFQSEEDLPYEEELLRNQYSVKHWLRYIEHKEASPDREQLYAVYERAVKELPGSYKLWSQYLRSRRSEVKGKYVIDPLFAEVNQVYERSLVFMNKMPRIWLEYIDFLISQGKVTETRLVLNRCLRSLPITQHNRIWPLYIDFVRMHDITETGIRIFRRYMKLCPEDAETFIEYLLEREQLDEAALMLAKCVNNQHFVSKRGESHHQLWNELCELISKNPDKVK